MDFFKKAVGGQKPLQEDTGMAKNITLLLMTCL
jgi:hypothetical protein